MVVLTALRRREPTPLGGNKGPLGRKFAPKSNGGPMDVARGLLAIGDTVADLGWNRARDVCRALKKLGLKGSMREQPDGNYTVTRVS